MDPSERTKVDREIVPNFQELIDEGGVQLRDFSFQILSPD